MIPSVNAGRVAITGALSFTGRYLAAHLLERNLVSSIVNLSSRTTPISSHNISPEQVESSMHQAELSFHDPARLTSSLEGVDVLYCTYWIRFSRGDDNHFEAAKRCRTLFECAQQAGVQKVVFTAHTGMSLDSPYQYIAGKAHASQYLREICAKTGMNYAIAKPCGIFGDVPCESILFNNAAYVMRRTPLFLLPKDGRAKFQPIYVKDLVQLMVDLGNGSIHTTGEELDAVGKDAPMALDLFRTLRDSCLSDKRPIFRSAVAASHLPTKVVGAMTKPLDWYTGDILLDSDDLDLMYSGLTVADDPMDERIAQRKGILEWMAENGSHLGLEYVNSMDRYYYPRKD
mmetsp:Transcript_17665/g.31907  ORF Transcript_17665/g.31907 Transcript_17665/m.31907 type:complete len:344 (-) Transcript_17665:50-1081(-)|eukprot:CAMPEP_0198295616 /NCGR_PEP_ID=MMETSP1449-20131203/28656_1 /TAXON_ID=420275 /ORGANISM="Attheya septentrionalis, Strain CCMP2084" /LENGTH=343 /DNA_ID=CAMNT_0043995981 /DNA_START=95 /DNA_END=1126 /DNA_ORIENTATION=+